MKCPKCQFENREEAKFCLKCGEKLELYCPTCSKALPLGAVFCDQCGQQLVERAGEKEGIGKMEGERKHVTVLFSDLSGYTAMSERLDPEEVKEITGRVLGEISKVIDKYGGFVEKFVGDAVMALFGAPIAHEDDPVRAIWAAREIHDGVKGITPELEGKIGHPLTMHTGINTGLVVTGEINLEKGTHGVAGDAINLASRLSDLARPGEILVGPDTYRQAEGHFVFEALEPTTVKGKVEPIAAYRFLSPKDQPVTIHRLSGLRAELIGRKVEVAHLKEAVENLKDGKGSIFSVCGDAGTGKSRLVEEFKASLDLNDIQWLEGHAYAYSQNIPYFPLIDLLNRVFQIEEGDAHEAVQEKIESGIEALVGKKGDIAPYVGSLYSLSYPVVEEVSPEFWKSRLQEVTLTIISALAQKAPTVFFLEDLHWADPSFVELLRHTLQQVRQPAIVLCVYRPVFSLFTSHQLSGVGRFYHEIRLQDLSLSEAQDMLESLLETKTIPSDLKRFVQGKAEGNPFYLEELVNSLIESETLVKDNGSWKIARPITESDISSTIHGLISGRLDRLEKETKRILQEASVIGRAFLYEILRRVTELEGQIDRGLSTLERLDLIRARSLQPDLEYMFKHPLTQEVVYNGLLKKDRQEIHEQTARVMERLFQDRVSEFYETLAFHFKRGQSVHKAIDYLMKSGEKSLGKYAVEEAHQYYKEAFDLLSNKPDKTKEEERLFIDLLIKWAFVFYYRGDFKNLTDLLFSYEALARSLNDKAQLGMFYAWIGFTLLSRRRQKGSYEYLLKALEVGEQIGDLRVVGYACTWLAWTCSGLGPIDDAITYGKRACEIAKSFPSDHYLYFKALGGLAHSYCNRGEGKKAFEAGKSLVAYGQRYSNNRSLFMGHVEMGLSHYVRGDFRLAAESAKKAITVSVDPFYSTGGKLLLALTYIQNAAYEMAEDLVQKVMDFSEKFGSEIWGTPALMGLGIITAAEGRFSEGLKILEDARQIFLKEGERYYLARTEFILGKLYLQMVEGGKSMRLSAVAKNLGFLVKNVPFASKKAEHHLNRAIGVAKQAGAMGILGEAYLELGNLHRAKKRIKKAIEFMTEAVKILEHCEADEFLKQAKGALASLGKE
jgi:class 3 adenylate cyclase/tetratricopeptide (TPR) repeat protein